jgi:hypothetical protein
MNTGLSMENSQTLVRSPQPIKTQSSESTPHENRELSESESPIDEMPINLYREAGRKPYLCDLMELNDEYTHFDMKSKSDFIDEYILSKVDSKTEYKEMFENLLDKAKADKESVYKQVEDLFDFLKIQKKLEDALKEKEEFEKRDPLTMKSAELKRWINSRI